MSIFNFLNPQEANNKHTPDSSTDPLVISMKEGKKEVSDNWEEIGKTKARESALIGNLMAEDLQKKGDEPSGVQ